MFSMMKRVSTCPYQLTIFGLLIIGLLLTIDRVTPGVFEQYSVIFLTDYATLSPFLMTLSILIQVLYQKKVNFGPIFSRFSRNKTV